MRAVVIVILSAIMTVLLVLTSCFVSRGEGAGAWVEYLGSEVNEELGIVNVYYVHCDGDYAIALEITWLDGAVELRAGDYCEVKIYLPGAIALVRVAGVAEAPEFVGRVYLPVVMR